MGENGISKLLQDSRKSEVTQCLNPLCAQHCWGTVRLSLHAIPISFKYHPFPFHHFSPSTTINNFQVHHPFMYTTSTKNSLHLSSSLFHLSLGSKTLCYKKSRATFLLPLTSQKALCMPLTPFTKAYIIQVTILATNFFFLYTYSMDL